MKDVRLNKDEALSYALRMDKVRGQLREFAEAEDRKDRKARWKLYGFVVAILVAFVILKIWSNHV